MPICPALAILTSIAALHQSHVLYIHTGLKANQTDILLMQAMKGTLLVVL